VARQVQGQTVTYIERLAELGKPQSYVTAWQVDAGIGYHVPSAGSSLFSSFSSPSGPATFSGSITFDPTTAHNVTLTNGNLTATNTSNVADQGVEIAIASAHTSGKWYFEMTLTHDVDHGSAFGVATTSAIYSNLNANGTGGIACYINGNIFTNGSNSGATIGGMINGDVIGVALDLDNRTVWFKPVAGSGVGTGWNGSGTANPATNTGGVVVPIGAILPYTSFAASSGGDPYWYNVVLLDGFEGVNGSTGAPGMTDQSPSAHGTATAHGSAQISTARSKFGSSSLLNSGITSDYISWTGGTDFQFGSGKFTVECWVFPTLAGNQPIVGVWGSGFSWLMGLEAARALAWRK
jgi:hypothetical protein